MNLNEYNKILTDLGFENDGEQYIDSELVITDYSKGKERISVETVYTKEYIEYLNNLPEGTEYEVDTEQCDVVAINIETDKFAYPEGGNSLDEYWEGGIRLCLDSECQNFQSLSLKNFQKALWMSRNPIQAKFQIVKNFIKGVELFYSKHSDLIKKLGLIEEENSILLVGKLINETEPYIEFKFKFRSIRIYFNIFTNQLVITKSIINRKYIQVDVNNLSSEELEQELKEYLKL